MDYVKRKVEITALLHHAWMLADHGNFSTAAEVAEDAAKFARKLNADLSLESAQRRHVYTQKEAR